MTDKQSTTERTIVDNMNISKFIVYIYNNEIKFLVEL